MNVPESALPEPPEGRDRQSILAGAVAILLGAAAIVEGRRYAVGSLLRMGPGYFPIALGTLLVALGLALALFGFTRRAQPSREGVLWRPVAMIPAGIAGFAFLLPRFGLTPATFFLVIAASLSEPRIEPLPTVLLAGGMTVAVWVVFAVLLGLRYPLLAW